MSVSSRRGVFAYKGQAAKGTAATGDFYRHKALDINLGPTEMSEPWAPEVGGGLFTEGIRKTASLITGTATIQPRMENVFGWLLYAMTGKASLSEDDPVEGCNTHIFTPDSSDHGYLPWLTIHKWIPGSTAADALGEIMQDCKIGRATFMLAAMAPLTVQLGIVGRIPTLVEQPSWSYVNDYEDAASVPSGNQGYFKLPSFSANAMPTPSVEVTLINTLSAERPENEIMVGDYYPDDIVPMGRGLTLRWRYKWEDPDFYQSIMTGAVDGTTWTCETYQSSAHVRLATCSYITGTTPYAFEIYVPEMTFSMAGPVRLAGNNILYTDMIGMVEEPASDDPYRLKLVTSDSVGEFSWPS